ncbi:hypothetical protein [Fructilactobacillus carniphilus]|uniref:SMODS-associated NUDIX domain-containing protein n=1 Tax=Fructilactobacillus carniphilus TaxID=2940297 RepID=A0ABY5BYC3_9LACO|nr:hypothetical protein [Fructilactobacillus carniphilus]USS90794.1 hypothetical protein M3M37_00780 [Fructilactobacillus carniphilus]
MYFILHEFFDYIYKLILPLFPSIFGSLFGLIPVVISIINNNRQIANSISNNNKQIKNSINNTDKQIADTRESQFMKSRPFFLIRFRKDRIRYGNPENRGDRRNRLYITSQRYLKKDEYLKFEVEKIRSKLLEKQDLNANMIPINNVSNKEMIAVQIIAKYEHEEEVFKIDLIPPRTELFLISKYYILDSVDKFKELRYINIYFLNELREQQGLFFSIDRSTYGFACNENLKYEKTKTYLENKTKDKNLYEYDFVGFEETERLHRKKV